MRAQLAAARDFSSVVIRVRDPAVRVQFIICADRRDADDVVLTVPAPIIIPRLSDRASELPRVVDEYALDAIAALGVRHGRFIADDRAWIVEHEASSLSEIEKANVAARSLRTSSNMTAAAARLGMAPVSLSRWLGRRRLPPMRPTV